MPKKKSPSTHAEKEFLESLRSQPELFERFRSILALAQEPDESGKIRSADQVEALLIEQTRKLGAETLQGWAKQAESKVSAEHKSKTPGAEQREKKRLKWWSIYGQVQVTERIWRDPKNSYVRILPNALGVSSRKCSIMLQRALSDFGLEYSFESAVARVKEHYGFCIGKSTLSKVTSMHAKKITESLNKRASGNALPAIGAKVITTETDGSFLRIVSTGGKSDRRKTRKINYQEVRLCAATALGAKESSYEASFEDVDQVGLLWSQCAKAAGMGMNSHVHIVCDGAAWIENQAKKSFGDQGSYLIDFYHVCEYLHAASEACSDNPKRWMKTQKKRLKRSDATKVIKGLSEYLEPQGIEDENAPVRRAHRYLTNRESYLDYKQAIDKELPIGSGLIESANKHVIQARMKIPGASWSIANAEAFVQARAFRANKKWELYWKQAA